MSLSQLNRYSTDVRGTMSSLEINIYSQYYYDGFCPEKIKKYAKENAYDLEIGNQNERTDERQYCKTKMKRSLK